MSAQVIDRDRGYQRIKRDLMRKASVTVGIQSPEAEGQREDGKTTNIMVASTHEFGAPERNIQSRSFMRATFDKFKRKYERLMKTANDRIMMGKSSPKRELFVIGETHRTDILRRIKAGIPPGWAESTAAYKEKQGKSGDVTLWDTGQLMNSIRSVVSK